MDKSNLKKKLLDAVETRSDDIIDVGEWIWRNPEVRFKEYKTANFAANIFRNLDLDVEKNISITGVKTKINGTEQS